MRKIAGRERDSPPVACSLSAPDLEKRRELINSVFSGTLRMDDLEDGYAFTFPGSTEWAEKLVGMISAERACCPFLTFEVLFEPDGGQISLRVTGPEGAKTFIEMELMAPPSA